MKLHCKVIGIEHASQFTDEQGRLTIRVQEADFNYKTLRIADPGHLKLGDEFVLSEANVTHLEGGAA